MTKILMISALCLIQILSLAAQEKSDSKATEVINAERNFAAASDEKGMKTAFLANAADEGIVFTDQPTNAKKLWQAIPESASRLAWKPALAGISASGEIGFTTGPFEFSPNKTSAPKSFGEYVTIWKKQANGSWKFVLDIGIHHENSTFEQNLKIKTIKFAEKSANKSSAWKESDQNFQNMLKTEGIAASYKKFASPQIRLLREKYEPFDGKISADGFLSTQKDSLILNALGSESVSDFAYVYGEYQLTTAETKTEHGFYLQIWQLDAKGWQIALDLQLPLPQK